MESVVFSGVPRSAYESADRMLALARAGRIKQHLLGDTSQVRHGTVEDRSVDDYCNFLKSKLCYEIMQLEGEAAAWEDEGQGERHHE